MIFSAILSINVSLYQLMFPSTLATVHHLRHSLNAKPKSSSVVWGLDFQLGPTIVIPHSGRLVT